MPELDGHIRECIDCGIDLCKLSVVVSDIERVDKDNATTSHRMCTIFAVILHREEWDEWWISTWGDELEIYKIINDNGLQVCREDLDSQLNVETDSD